MIKVMEKLFKNTLFSMCRKNIGDKIFIILDEDRRIELSLIQNKATSYFDNISMVLCSKKTGMLHTHIVNLKDIPGFSKDKRLIFDKKEGFLWSCGLPTEEEYLRVNQVLEDYIKLWK